MRNSGNLDTKIAFYDKGNSKSSWGENTLSPTKKLECWAEMLTLSTRDYLSAKGTGAENSVTFVIREQLRKEIDSSMRIKIVGDEDTIYEIIRINPDVIDKQWCYIMAVNK